MDRLDVEILIEKLEPLPILPFVAVELLTKIQDVESSVQDIAGLIEMDPGLTLRILKLANSTFYRRARPAETVKEAVERVGPDAVKILALTPSVMAMRDETARVETAGFDARRFWLHSIACATGARIICSAKHSSLADLGFVAGLLHDVGKAVLHEMVPESYAQTVSYARSRNICALEAERTLLGVDHLVAGQVLAERWCLPDSLRDVIRLHHQPALCTGGEEVRSVLAAVHVADWISNRYGLGADAEGGGAPVDPGELGRLDVSPDKIYHRLREELEAIVSVFDTSKPSTGLLLDVLQKSNRQLGTLSGRVHQSLLALNRKHAVMEGLAAMGKKLQSTLPLTEAARVVAEGTLRAIDADAVTLLVSIGRDRFLQVVARRAGEGTVETEINITADESAQGPVFGDGGREGTRLHLIAGGRTLGSLTAWHDSLRRASHPGDTADMALFADMGAPALERSLRLSEMHGRLEGVQAAAQARGLQARPTSGSAASDRPSDLLKEVMTAVGHEFNNLLSGILGQTELMEVEERSPEGRKRLENIRKAVTEFAQLLARYQEKFGRAVLADPLDAVDLERVARNAIDLQGRKTPGRPRNREIQLHVQSGGPWLVGGNPSEIHEVISNLLLNALDATAEKGEVSVHVGSKGSFGFVRVEDTGHGIPSEHLDRIFEPFFTTKEGQGTGIGLAVCRAIVRNLGGDLKASSIVGKGTVFEARFPRWRGEAAANPGRENEPSMPARARGLLVEDNDATREALQDILHFLGVAVDCAADLQTAEALLGAGKYDFVITDLYLEGSTGVDVLQAVRRRGSAAPVLLVTGARKGGEKDLVEESGFADVLYKPFTIRQLSNALSKMLDSAGAAPLTPRPGESFGRLAPKKPDSVPKEDR